MQCEKASVDSICTCCFPTMQCSLLSNNATLWRSAIHFQYTLWLLVSFAYMRFVHRSIMDTCNLLSATYSSSEFDSILNLILLSVKLTSDTLHYTLSSNLSNCHQRQYPHQALSNRYHISISYVIQTMVSCGLSYFTIQNISGFSVIYQHFKYLLTHGLGFFFNIATLHLNGPDIQQQSSHF